MTAERVDDATAVPRWLALLDRATPGSVQWMGRAWPVAPEISAESRCVLFRFRWPPARALSVIVPLKWSFPELHIGDRGVAHDLGTGFTPYLLVPVTSEESELEVSLTNLSISGRRRVLADATIPIRSAVTLVDVVPRMRRTWRCFLAEEPRFITRSFSTFGEARVAPRSFWRAERQAKAQAVGRA